MKNIVFIIGCIATFIFGVVLARSCERETQIKGAELREAEIKKQRDELGALAVKAEYNLATMNELVKSKDRDIQSLAKEVGGLKKIISTIKFDATTSDSFTTIVKERVIIDRGDTLTVTDIDYTDPWLSFKGFKLRDKFHGSYSIKNQFSTTSYWEGKRFQKKKLAVLIKSENPNTDISSVRPLYVTPPPKKWYETRAAAFGIGIIAGGALMIAR